MSIEAYVRLAWAELDVADARRVTACSLIQAVVGHPIELFSQCAACGSLDHGRLRVRGAPVCVSVAYTSRYAVVAVADLARVTCLGVDAEPTIDVVRDREGVAGALGAPQATTRDWVRVEAALKADGRGLRVDPAAVRVVVTNDVPARWTAHVPGAAPYTGWDAEGPEKTLVSVALRTLQRESAGNAY